MFRWFKKVLSDGLVEDECQELSPRAIPPVTPEEAFHKWIMTAPAPPAKSKQPAKSKKQDNV